jgi:translocation and assembly module TamB
MKRVFWILLTPLAILFLLGVGLKYLVVPRVESWALAELQRYSSQNLPVEIKAHRLTLYFFKPSVGLEDIEIRPLSPDLKKAFEMGTIRSLRAHLDMFQLLAGRLELSAVVVDSPSLQLELDPFLKNDSKPEPLPLDQIFSLTERIPLERVFIQNLYLDLKSTRQKIAVNIRQGGFLLTNMGKNITGKTEIPDLRISVPEVGDFSGAFDAHLYLTRQSLKIIQMGVRLNESELVLRGELNDFKNVTILPQGVLNISAKITLSDIYHEIRHMRPQLKIPLFSGSLHADSEFHFKGLDKITGQGQIKTQKVVIDKFQIGDASLQGSLKDNKVKISEFKVSHPAGAASLNDTELEFDQNLHYKSKIHVSALDLQKFFVSLGLNDIPASVLVSGDLPCQGQFLEPLTLECAGKIKGQNLWVRSKLQDEKSEIVGLDEISAEGSMKLDSEGVT